MSETVSHQQDADSRLLAEIAGGKTEAFAALYDRLSGPLFTLCVRMIGDAGEAEDVLQEAFLAIWRRAATYDPERASVFTWAVHLTRCKIIDHLRARGRRLRLLTAPSDQGPEFNGTSHPPEALAPTATAAENADRHEQAAQVRSVLRDLPAEQSQVIELAFFSDLTHHEISARLAQPLGTIKARIRRGLLKLRDGLKGTP